MEKITVVDNVMGSGKSSWAIQHMNDIANVNDRFIYITPINTEVDRIKDACSSRDFRNTSSKEYEGKKMHVVKDWLQDRANICTTHSLFRAADEEFLEYIRSNNYTLILDEAMSVIEFSSVKPADIKQMVQARNIELMDDGRVIWIGDNYDGRFNDIKAYAKAGTLYHLNGGLLIYSFPPEAFRAFSKVYCLTYLFEAQQQRYYFDMHRLEYEKKAVKRSEDGTFTLVDHNIKNEGRADMYSLIKIYKGPLNDVGSREKALSMRWFDRTDMKDSKATLKRASRNYLMNIQHARASESIWTTKKGAFRVKDYASAFVPFNCRGTNDYAEARALVYALNRFMKPEEVRFFKSHRIEVDQDLLAVSDLLQWIWRSRIRNGQPVNLYLPSSRMRSLLLAWSRYEI
jgi:hypothetical protein